MSATDIQGKNKRTKNQEPNSKIHEMVKRDLSERLFKFAGLVLQLLKSLPDTPEGKVIRYQLAKAATSSGANYEESQAGSSKRDFANKIRISLREMRESNYWLRLCEFSFKNEEINLPLLKELIPESRELIKILGSILNKCQ